MKFKTKKTSPLFSEKITNDRNTACLTALAQYHIAGAAMLRNIAECEQENRELAQEARQRQAFFEMAGEPITADLMRRMAESHDKLSGMWEDWKKSLGDCSQAAQDALKGRA